MIVCHCQVVNDHRVARALDEGARSVAQVCRATGAGRGCGSCVFTLRRLVCQHEAQSAARPAAASEMRETAPMTAAPELVEVHGAAS